MLVLPEFFFLILYAYFRTYAWSFHSDTPIAASQTYHWQPPTNAPDLCALALGSRRSWKTCTLCHARGRVFSSTFWAWQFCEFRDLFSMKKLNGTESQRTPFGKLRKELLDTQVCSGSVQGVRPLEISWIFGMVSLVTFFWGWLILHERLQLDMSFQK